MERAKANDDDDDDLYELWATGGMLGRPTIL